MCQSYLFFARRLPEIGEEIIEKNPLLSEETKLPDFYKATTERCIAAVNKQTVEYEVGVTTIVKEIESKLHFTFIFVLTGI